MGSSSTTRIVAGTAKRCGPRGGSGRPAGKERGKLSWDDLIAEYDQEAKNVGSWGVAFLRDEIFQRDREAQGARMEKMTREMARLTNMIRWLTVIITVLTGISTYAVIASSKGGRCGEFCGET